MEETYILKIYRGHPGNQYFEEFELPLTLFSNVISGLMQIQKNPVNIHGEKVEPVVWEQGCLEEVCGSCSMLINGYPRQACTALILPIIEKTKSRIVTLAPFSKFPLVRDLIVDRSIMFENLKKVHAWIDADTSYDKGRGPKISPEQQEVMYSLSTCMTCGCCVEGCPQISSRSKFLGPQIIAQVRLFNENPTGKLEALKRLKPLMGEDGVAECGNAQNCNRVCPKEIPLVESIAAMGRKITEQIFKNLF
ncbi:MAG TPA: succinate dehydrogenase iron-sulfur subunit [Parachlamydiaceae bacterium]|nr:succinate dehydrogenase iron-sulfur subunit [Parachlamydiaceae bacterium]